MTKFACAICSLWPPACTTTGPARGAPFGDDARAYYDPDLRSLALTVKAEVPPGVRWQYNNFHPLLLGIILERATGESVSAYLSDKIWKPLGMEAPGSWSLDSRHDGFEKMESGLNGRAVDFAKFGMLYLHRGILQGREIVPPGWVKASTQRDPSVAGPSTSPAGEEWVRALDYGYLWWIDPKAPGRFFAMGNFGQVIYVAPDRDAVLVRFGASYGNIAWIPILRDLASRLPPNQARIEDRRATATKLPGHVGRPAQRRSPRSARAGRATPLRAAKRISCSQRAAALARTPVFPERTRARPLTAFLRPTAKRLGRRSSTDPRSCARQIDYRTREKGGWVLLHEPRAA